VFPHFIDMAKSLCLQTSVFCTRCPGVCVYSGPRSARAREQMLREGVLADEVTLPTLG